MSVPRRSVLFVAILSLLVLQCVFFYTFSLNAISSKHDRQLLDDINFTASQISMIVTHESEFGSGGLSRALSRSLDRQPDGTFRHVMLFDGVKAKLYGQQGKAENGPITRYLHGLDVNDAEQVRGLIATTGLTEEPQYYISTDTSSLFYLYPFDLFTSTMNASVPQVLLLERNIENFRQDAANLSQEFTILQSIGLAGLLVIFYFYGFRRQNNIASITSVGQPDYSVRPDEDGTQSSTVLDTLHYTEIYQSAIDVIAESVCVVNRECAIVFVNQACRNLFELDSIYAGPGRQHEGIFSFLSKNLEKDLQQRFFDVESGQDIYHPAVSLDLPSGKKLQVEYWMHQIVGPASDFIVVRFVDVSDKLASRDQLRLKESAIDQSIAAICITGSEGSIQYVNRAFVKMFQVEDVQAVTGKRISDLLHSEDNVELSILATLEKCGEFIGELRLEQGGVVQVVASREHGARAELGFMMFSMIDVSEKRDMQDALQRNHELHSRAEQIAHVGSWDWNISTDQIIWSDEVYRIFGLVPQSRAATYESFLEMVHPDDRNLVSEKVQTVLNDPRAVYLIEHKMIRADGEVRLLEEQGKVYRDEAGVPRRMIGVVRDVTDSRNIQERLNSFKTTLDQIKDCVFIFDPDTLAFTYVNRGAVEQVGYSVEELFDMTPVDIKPTYSKADFLRLIGPMMQSENSRISIETVHQHKAGYWIPVEISLSYVAPKGEPARFVAIVQDVTERKEVEAELERHRENLEELVAARTRELAEAQDELVKSEKLATLGRLTATVSHELRNPLGAIKPSMFLLKRYVDSEDERITEIIERINRNINRCDHIIDELLDFTRSIRIELHQLDFSDWLAGTIEEQVVGEDIELDIDIEAGLQGRFDSNQMRRVVINLIDNACQAMREQTNDSHQLTISSAYKDGLAELVIADNGPGMSEEVKKQIFEPLFSTKGFGVGLGLPIVKQIVERHNGSIDVISEPGSGSRFIIHLPLNQHK